MREDPESTKILSCNSGSEVTKAFRVLPDKEGLLCYLRWPLEERSMVVSSGVLHTKRKFIWE